MTGSVPSFPLRTKLSNPENGGRHRSVCIYERVGIATPAADDGDELLSSVTDARPLLNYVGHFVCGRPSRRRRFPAVLFPVLSPVDTKSMMRTYIRASRRTLSTASDQTSQLACTYVSNPHIRVCGRKVDRLNGNELPWPKSDAPRRYVVAYTLLSATRTIRSIPSYAECRRSSCFS